MPCLLHADSVAKSFRGVAALAGASLEVAEGEIVGVIGPNGAGKTTLFNVIAGVFRPTSGRVFFRGRNITCCRRTAGSGSASPGPSS